MHYETHRRHHIREICILRSPWRWLRIGLGFLGSSRHRRRVSVGLDLVSCLGIIEGVSYCVEVHVVGLVSGSAVDRRFVVEMVKRFEQFLVYWGLFLLRRIVPTCLYSSFCRSCVKTPIVGCCL